MQQPMSRRSQWPNSWSPQHPTLMCCLWWGFCRVWGSGLSWSSRKSLLAPPSQAETSFLIKIGGAPGDHWSNWSLFCHDQALSVKRCKCHNPSFTWEGKSGVLCSLDFPFSNPGPHAGLGVIGLFAFLSQPTLRRMCYLTIKEMSCIAEDVIIVTSRQVLGLWMVPLMDSVDTETIFSHVY